MKAHLIAIPLALCLGACATTGPSYDARHAADLALYRAHALEEVGSIPFSGSVDRWTSLGESALAVWTSPSRAWLLELGAPCRDLQYAHAIGFQSRGLQVSAGLDSVVVLSRAAPPYIPCRIRTIQPLDVPAIRAVERGAD